MLNNNIDLSAGVSDAPTNAGAAPSAIDLSAGVEQSNASDSSIDLSAGIEQGNSQATGEIKQAHPSVWERVKDAVTEGLPNYSHRTIYDPKYGQTQLLTPEAALTPEEQRAHPIATGAAEVAGGLTSPTNIAIIGATGGLGELPGAAGAIIPRLISAGFSAQSLYSAYNTVPEIKAAYDSGNYAEVKRLLTHAVLDVGMGYLAGRHAVKGQGALSGKTDAKVDPNEPTTVNVDSAHPVHDILEDLPEGGKNEIPNVRITDTEAQRDEILHNDAVPAESRERVEPDEIVTPAKGSEFHEPISPSELDSGAHSLFGKDNYSDLSEAQQNSVVESLSKRSVGTSIAGPEGRAQLGLDDAEASVRAPADLAPLRSRIVKDDFVPVVSHSEILNKKIQDIINNGQELEKLGIDPSQINTPADAERILGEVADHIHTNLDPRASAVIGFQAQRQLASELGMSVEELLSRKSGDAFNAEHAIAARAILNQSGINVVKAARLAAEDTSMRPDFNQTVFQHGAILDSVKGMTAEAGRALGSFNVQDLPSTKISNVLKTLPEDAQAKAIKLLSKIDPENTRQLNNFLEQIKPNSTADKIFEFYRNSLLSAPSTLIKKGASEMTMVALEASKKLAAAGIAKLTGADRYASESFWYAKGAIEALRHAKSVFNGEFDLEDAPGFEKTGEQAIKGAVGNVVRIPSRLLSAQTNLMYLLNYSGEIEAQAARIAIKDGLSGRDLTSRQEYLSQHPTEEMTAAAHETALNNTFQTELGKFGKKVQSAMRSEPTGLLHYFIPFFKTPINLLKQSSYYSPYGLLKGVATGDIDMQSRGLVGSSLAAGIAYLAAQGVVTGGGSVDYKKKQTLESTGWQPYSLHIGGKYYSYRKLEPLGQTFALIADTLHGMKIGDSLEMTQSKADSAVRHIMSSLKDVAFLPTLSSVIEFINNPDARGKNFIGRQIAGFIPAIVKDVAQTVDPVVRSPKTITDNLEVRLPGLTKNVPAVIGGDGKPVRRPTNELGGANPFPVSTATNDPVQLELARLGQSTPKAPTTVKRHGKVIEITPAQQEMVTRYENAKLHDRLEKIVLRNGWQSLPDSRRIEAITRMRKEITESRLQRVMKMQK